MKSCFHLQTLTMLLALKFIAWLVEVGGLLALHKCAPQLFCWFV